ncbi:MAG: MOSC domain-containing protein [Gammaproteobacteria bacterium]|nr:MOSC domain-containing protein [Gammaproteobacteria bacterium]
MNRIGRLDSVWRYPVKSMRGEAVDEVFVAYTGVMGDRVYAVRSSAAGPEFPWHTGREQEELVLCQARFKQQNRTLLPEALDAAHADALNPPYPDAESFRVAVKMADGSRYDIDDPAFLERLADYSDGQLQLVFTQKNAVDCRPLSLFSLQTLQQLEGELEMALDQRRFRANFYVDWDSAAGFYENELVNRKLRIGDRLEIMLLALDPRCKMITIDPETGETTPRLLKHVARKHDGYAGVYAVVLIEGTVRPGDQILLLEE